jgi:DNA-binding GntR family transcriptional regulator
MNDRIDPIVERIAADLRSGQFAPGAWLKQVDLQARYGVGRTQIRKALETLAVRRMIRHELNRGFSAHPSEKSSEYYDILAVRVAIETGFAAAMTERATAADLVALRALADAFGAKLRDGKFSELYDTNLKFHRRLLACAGNPTMVQMVEELRLRTSPAPVLQWSNGGRIEQSAREHYELIEALAARDAAALGVVIRRHILQPRPAHGGPTES